MMSVSTVAITEILAEFQNICSMSACASMLEKFVARLPPKFTVPFMMSGDVFVAPTTIQ
jgi:hypothetical protein